VVVGRFERLYRKPFRYVVNKKTIFYGDIFVAPDFQPINIATHSSLLSFVRAIAMGRFTYGLNDH
jgi:hypothetical protein